MNPMLVKGLNILVLADGVDWSIGTPIVLKYITLLGKSPFHNVSAAYSDIPFILKGIWTQMKEIIKLIDNHVVCGCMAAAGGLN